MTCSRGSAGTPLPTQWGIIPNPLLDSSSPIAWLKSYLPSTKNLTSLLTTSALSQNTCQAPVLQVVLEGQHQDWQCSWVTPARYCKPSQLISTATLCSEPYSSFLT